MSAAQQSSMDTPERRNSQRLRVTGTVPVIFGRGEGVLVDLSERGARLRHSVPVRRGTTVRISFEWEHSRFSAMAEVLAARVVGLGSGPSYESRVRFTSFDPGSEAVLTGAMESIAGRDMRRWVANLRGWSDETHTPERRSNGSFVRCRFHGVWWEKKVTSDTSQPVDGFLLPAGSTEEEIRTLCETYAHGDENERNMIRLMASVAVDESLGVS